MVNQSVPVLGRDLTVRLPKHQLAILKVFAQNAGMGLGEAASALLGEKLSVMARAYCAELAVRASLIA